MADTTRPDPFRFEIPQGSHFHLEFPPFVTADTGEAFDFTADPEGDWTARMEIRTQAGVLVAAFATSGEDGTIQLGATGVIALDLAPEHTDLLTPTTEYGGTLTGPLYADIVLVDPADSEPWTFFRGQGGIARKVTEL